MRATMSIGVSLALLAIVVTAVATRTTTEGQSRQPVVDTRVVLVHGTEKTAVTTTPDGVLVGRPTAPVTLDIYEDYSCSQCRTFESAFGSLLDRIVMTGQVRIAYHPLGLVSGYGTVAGNAAACVLAHQPASWPLVHAKLFEDHATSTASWTKEDAATWLIASGADDEDTVSCSAAGAFDAWIDASTRSAAAAGITSVPTLRVKGSTVATASHQNLVEALRSAGAILPDDMGNP
ncbi:thioredoxin domain-containing protein [Clavibacter sp. VKM Ac-2872]|uniref:DsbA family protein n=1 Tax=Clavibacter sp. VKM Ac-2872 TaxID=2783812 RepID=UPI00188AA07B|nr:thioredoxin domain-containing protein [Clavibacter sp. VKM Ac-2872]